jgi:hypothetical protein
MTRFLGCVLSDRFWFPAVQVSLAAFLVFAFIRDAYQKHKAGDGPVHGTVTRGKASMALFYGAYVAITSIFVGLTLAVETAKGYRVSLVVFDVLAVAYLCLLNRWCRNKLVELSIRLPKAEHV